MNYKYRKLNDDSAILNHLGSKIDSEINKYPSFTKMKKNLENKSKYLIKIDYPNNPPLLKFGKKSKKKYIL